MRYPDYMTATDIMEFEYEYNRLIDMERQQGIMWDINAECQIAAQLTQELLQNCNI
jgi:hypothetical protein